MNKKIIFYFHSIPWPPRVGSHHRCLQVLEGLKALNCTILFITDDMESRHIQDKNVALKYMQKNLVDDVFVLKKTNSVNQIKQKIFSKISKLMPNSFIDIAPLCLRGSKSEFSRKIGEYKPDIIYMNYAMYDGYIQKRVAGVKTVIDTHDIISFHRRMATSFRRYMRNDMINPNMVEDSLFSIADNHMELSGDLNFEKEMKIYDKYDYAIAISKKETSIIRAHTKHTCVLHIPMTKQVSHLKNNYKGACIFPASANYVNVIGYCYFVKKILPKLLKRIPSFKLKITGAMSDRYKFAAQDGVELLGFLPDLEGLYVDAAFMICPQLISTGQQTKIIESMARGVPVIVFNEIALETPIRHGENGYVANDPDEFAEYTIQLWNDRSLCKKLGESAKETIYKECSKDRLLAGLSKIVG